jgi:DNA-binding CsgD family transcriptional regulator
MLNLRTILALILYIPTAFAQTEQKPLVNYSAIDYKGENQNWGISQNNQREIFVANNAGLLVFNSQSWLKYDSPNGSILRSVKVVNDKVYTGCYMEFGFWKKNEFGKLDYTSLSQKIFSQILEDEQFWEILWLNNQLHFQSLNRIYVFSEGGKLLQIISSPKNIYKSFAFQGSVYFHVLEGGLYRLVDGKKKLVIAQEKLRGTLINRLAVLDGKIVLITQEKGLLEFRNGQITEWANPTNATLKNISIYSSLALKDGSICLGTISNGAYLLSKSGDALTLINQRTGLPNNTILSLFEDIDKHIWLGLDNGIGILNNGSPIRVFYDSQSELGTIYAAVLHEGYLYLGTNQGLFYRKYGTDTPFKFIRNTKGQVWALKILDGRLICCHHTGSYRIENQEAIPIKLGLGTWDIKKLNDSVYVQGNYDGLYVLDQNFGFKNKIKGFDISSRFFEFTDQQHVLVNHEYKGVFKIAISPDYEKALNVTLDKSVPKGRKSGLVSYNNRIIYFYEGGLYAFDNATATFKKDSVLSNLFLRNEGFASGKLIKANGKLWGFTKKNIVFIEVSGTTYISGKTPFSTRTRNDIAGFESLSFLSEGNYLLGIAKGYMLLNLAQVNQKPLKIYLNAVKVAKVDAADRSLSIIKPTSLNFEENNLSFSFSSVNFDKFTELNYRYQLVNYNQAYSKWSNQAEAIFKNLPPGSYVFKAQAKLGGVDSTNELSYAFTIERPWYFSSVMLFVYMLLLLLTFLAIHLISRRYFKNQQRKVLKKKKRELTLAKLESEREIVSLKNKKLLLENESKTRELASSTLSLAKNNEVLISIRDELNQQTETGKLKSIFDLIDKNLHKESSWELFQDAFNNTDKDFLKTLSERHSNLTPNDLRLAAYLRLNLASKEIAPLLNISYKSVEIKRYRLRKKLQLNKADNLVQYILEI